MDNEPDKVLVAALSSAFTAAMVVGFFSCMITMGCCENSYRVRWEQETVARGAAEYVIKDGKLQWQWKTGDSP